MTSRQPAVDPGPGAGSTRWRTPGPGPALAVYCLLAVVLTWPLAWQLGDHVPLGNNDLWQNYWNFWHWRSALLTEHASPYSTSLLYQPGEVSLAFHTHSPANVLTLLPIAALWSEAAALNVAVLLGFALSAWGAFLLCRELTADAAASFLAGLLFGFLPQHYEQTLEHLNLASYQGMPFFVLFLLRTLQRGGVANTTLCGVCFAWNALYAWHNGVMITLLGTVLALYAFVRGPRRPLALLRDLATAAVIATVVCLPFLWPLIRDWLAGLNPIKPPVAKGIDPLFLFLPPSQHPLWGAWLAPLYTRWRVYPSVGFTCYLSLVALATLVLGLRAQRRLPAAAGTAEPRFAASPRLWGGLAVVYLVLACGSELTLAGAERLAPMPFAATTYLPILQTLRVANRLVVPGALALAVLFAWAARALLEATARSRCCGLNRGRLFGLLVSLLLLDLLWVPYPTRPLPRPAWVEALRQTPAGLLLNVPGGHRARGAEDLYLQTLHGRPIVGGYTSVPPEFMEQRTRDLPWLEQVFVARPQTEVDPVTGLEDVLTALPVQVIVVHLGRKLESLTALARRHRGTPRERLYNPARSMPEAKLEHFRAAIRQICGAPHYADAEAEIYVTPAR